jgi:hypothetical protein
LGGIILPTIFAWQDSHDNPFDGYLYHTPNPSYLNLHISIPIPIPYMTTLLTTLAKFTLCKLELIP